MLTLYFAPGSSSMAAHIALHEVGAPFESRPLSFHRKENRTPAYLAINPEGKVPTLLIDGRPLTEVAGILFYLARRFPEAGLLPTDDIEAEAQVVSWMSFIAATMHPARRQGSERTPGSVSRLPNSGWAGANGRWGATRSPTSICSGCSGGSAARSIRTPAEFPNLSAHYDRMMARPAVQQDHRDRGRDRLRTAGVAAESECAADRVDDGADRLLVELRPVGVLDRGDRGVARRRVGHRHDDDLGPLAADAMRGGVHPLAVGIERR